jgi:hemerythrin-like metal-binding protein
MQKDKTSEQPEPRKASQLIIWTESYVLGVSKVDEQHQILISMINELHSGMLRGDGKTVIEEILDGLLSYTIYHFSTEEKYYDQYSLPFEEGHKKEHAYFTQKVSSFRDSFKQNKEGLSLEVLNFLMVWFLNHIDNSDRKACLFLSQSGLK